MRIILFLTLILSAAAAERLFIEGVKINGKSVKMAFDTGATHDVIFQKTAERIGLKIVKPKRPPKLAKGEVAVNMTRCKVRVNDGAEKEIILAVYKPLIKTDVDGVCGWHTIRKYILHIDAGGKARLLRKLPLKGMKGWQKFIIYPDSTLNFSAGSHTVYLDTGSFTGLGMPKAKFAEFTKGRKQTYLAAYLPASGFTASKVAVLDQMKIGDLLLKNIRISENPLKETYSSDYVMGTGALAGYETIIDEQDGYIYFKLSKKVRKLTPYNRLGAVFMPVGIKSAQLKAYVAPGSPADRAGLKNGDKLLKIDNEAIKDWRQHPEYKPNRFWISPENNEHTLEVERAGTILTFKVRLENFLDQ